MTNPTPTTASWETRLKEYLLSKNIVLPIEIQNDIIDFVRALLKENTTATLREVIREAHECMIPYLPPYEEKVAGRNSGLNDLIEVLQNKLTSEL